jgi:hypothetical protein
LAADDPTQPSLTIYNQNFAVVRQVLPLELKSGVNSVRVTDITMHLEPDSVILRDPTGKQFIQVLEQNYRADPLSEALLRCPALVSRPAVTKATLPASRDILFLLVNHHAPRRQCPANLPIAALRHSHALPISMHDPSPSDPKEIIAIWSLHR